MTVRRQAAAIIICCGEVIMEEMCNNAFALHQSHPK